MSNVIDVFLPTGLTLYATINRKSDGFWAKLTSGTWASGTIVFEAYNVAHITSYANTITEAPSSSGIYPYTLPTLPSGVDYRTSFWLQAGGSPVGSPTDANVWSEDWPGVVAASVAGVAAAVLASATTAVNLRTLGRMPTVAEALGGAAAGDFGTFVPNSIASDLGSDLKHLDTTTTAGHFTGVELTPTDSAGTTTLLARIARSLGIDTSGRVRLQPSGLDDVSVVIPTTKAATFREMIVQLHRRFFGPASETATQIKTYADDGTTVLTTQTISDDGTTQRQGSA